jgi:hypothetical protein
MEREQRHAAGALGGDFRPFGELAGWLARTVTAALLLGAGVIWLRLLAGALRRPLPWSGLILAAVAAAVAAAVVRLAWRLEVASRRQPTDRPKRGQNYFSPSRLEDDTSGGEGKIVLTPFPMPAGDVIQQLVRTRLPDGSERLAGWLRVVLAPGQRSANIHVAFCPPFARSPRISVQQREGPAARVKEGQLLPYGARLDLKLAQAAETSTSLVLEILVHADAPDETVPSRADRTP